MGIRANWKGVLKLGDLVCPVALYTAASTSERIVFHTLNRATGHRIHRQFVDGDTGKPVEKDDQVKGYEVATDDYVMLEPEEVAAAVPGGDKVLDISAFVGLDEVDDVYFDKPYYLAPSDEESAEAFALIREGLRAETVAAIARTVLFRRVRTVLIRPYETGLVATTLNFDYEVRSAEEAFAEVPELKLKGEMLDLARHIIDTKAGAFDPADYADRYEAALAEVVQAKIEGRRIEPPEAPKADNVIDLMAALRESAGAGKTTAGKGASKAKAKPKTKAAPRKAKAKAEAETKAAPARRKAG